MHFTRIKEKIILNYLFALRRVCILIQFDLMFRYGKTAQAAVSAMSYLAEHFEEEPFMANSADVAKARGLPQPLVAKLLTTLSQKGLVNGRPGPHGGYQLARHPSEMCLRQVVEVFERVEPDPQCPFGPGWCGVGAPCPLHDAIIEQNEQDRSFLETIRFDSFVKVKE